MGQLFAYNCSYLNIIIQNNKGIPQNPKTPGCWIWKQTMEIYN